MTFCARLPRRLGRTVAGFALGLALMHPLRAQDQGQLITPNYRGTDILQVIEAVGAVTGRTIIPDPRVRAQVSLYNTTPMTPAQFYQAFLQILQVHGYAAVESSGVTQIIPAANVRQMPSSPFPGEGAEIVTQVVQLENTQAAALVPVLRPMVATEAQMAATQGGSNMLILSDRADNMQRILNIIRRIDQAGAQDIDVIRLENASAGDVVQKLMALVQAAQAAGAAPTIQAVADDRTNSILLSGTESQRLRYRAFIVYLDTPSSEGGDTQVRYLNYANAEDLAAKLQTQFGGAVVEGAEAAGPEGGEVTIWSDEGTNALVMNAPSRILQDMQAVIDKIDIPRAQVHVEAIIVEVSEDKEAQLGLTWLTDGSSDNSAIGVTNFSGTTSGILNLAAVGAGGTPDVSTIGDGITAAVGRISDSGTSWAAVVSALRGDAGTNIVSTQSLVTLDNEESEIRVGQEVPFLTGQFTSTGAAQGSVNPFQTIQREEVGTSLKITPQINEGTGIRLSIEQETSSISAGASGAVDLVTNTRTITTSVFVNDGDVLVLGGLIDDQLLESEQRVPGLGKIPGLGWLFRARKTNRVKTNLMVFIRPTILRDSIDARFMSSGKYNYLQNLQRELANKPVQLMRNETHPELDPLPPPPDSAADSAVPEPATDGAVNRTRN
jgi:general secretion pathway protein D